MLNFNDLIILTNVKFVVIWKCRPSCIIMLLHYDSIFSGIKWPLKLQKYRLSQLFLGQYMHNKKVTGL